MVQDGNQKGTSDYVEHWDHPSGSLNLRPAEIWLRSLAEVGGRVKEREREKVN